LFFGANNSGLLNGCIHSVLARAWKESLATDLPLVGRTLSLPFTGNFAGSSFRAPVA
jgi:hypothetical protein